MIDFFLPAIRAGFDYTSEQKYETKNPGKKEGIEDFCLITSQTYVSLLELMKSPLLRSPKVMEALTESLL